MRIELFLDEGEEYPQLFSVWMVDQETGRADLTTRRNYVDDRKGWDQWRKTDVENIKLKADVDKLRELTKEMFYSLLNVAGGRRKMTAEEAQNLIDRMSVLGIEV